jgi:hypothetical protein
MATAPKKASAVIVIRDRNTTALPPMQLGSFHKLFEPDEYEGKKRFKSRFHINPAGITALAAVLQAKCIDAHFETMKKQVQETAAELKAEGKEKTALKIVSTAAECESPEDWIEGKLKDPHEKDKVQLPTLQLHVDAHKPLRKGQDESERELRDIKFWDSKGKLLDAAALKKMTSGTWCQPVVHSNLFLSKQLGPAPRCQLQLVGLQIIKLVEFGGGQEQAPDEADDDAMKAIMGADYDAADDLSNLGVGTKVSNRDAESGLELDTDDSPF